MQVVGGQMLQYLQEQMYYGRLSEEDAPRMDTYFYDLPEASVRRNKYIYPTGKTGDLRIVNWMEVVEMAGMVYSKDAFLYPRTCIKYLCGAFYSPWSTLFYSYEGGSDADCVCRR